MLLADPAESRQSVHLIIGIVLLTGLPSSAAALAAAIDRAGQFVTALLIEPDPIRAAFRQTTRQAKRSASLEGVPNSEMLRLEFADKRMILAQVSELRSIWRYASNPDAITLDKADGSSWRERRAKAEQDIARTASHLSQVAAERRKLIAPEIAPPVAEYERFAASFRYVPPPDQSKAIEDVLSDLASGHPMDRLVCGDVGFGKTEVALRAAAATVLTGRQVAIAAPTTVLARQHADTFRTRFSRLGFDVGELSRFVSPAEARAVKKGLADGSLKLVVGTQAIATKGVRFKELGFVVIDEEQRFGLADKAKLAQLGTGVHLLTLSATPIPRTMSQAYAGIRPISIIATAPARRIPVKTVVGRFGDALVAAALRREHRRRGQSFLVCPRIEDIEGLRHRLDQIVPELKPLISLRYLAEVRRLGKRLPGHTDRDRIVVLSYRPGTKSRIRRNPLRFRPRCWRSGARQGYWTSATPYRSQPARIL
jgi:transcription-repair coupling factor (superfamily II helicase)